MASEDYNFDWNDYSNENIQDSCRSNSIESVVSQAEIEATKKSEFVQLNEENEKPKLVASEGFEAQWNRLNGLSNTSDPLLATTNDIPIISNNDAFVISLLGDSGDGKSFLTDHLLPPIEKDRPTIIDERQRSSSTTANVMCYESTSFSPEVPQTNLLLLDYEGEQGTSLPYMLTHMRNEWTIEHAEKRRTAVSKYFPKLAYTISNIIILVSRDDLSKYDYISRCYDFAERATKKLQHNPYKPIIIMIHNYCPATLLQPIQEVTKQFFKTHRDETKKLRDFFEAVYCMRLPYKINGTSNSRDITQTNQLFSTQIDELKGLIVSIYKKHKKERILPHISWLDITSHVIDSIAKDRTVMMHTLLRQVLVKDPGDAEQNTVLVLFTMLYNKRDVHSPRWFHFCRTFAMSVLARAMAIRFIRNMKYVPENNVKNMAIREEARVCLEKLWTWLDKFRPCTAIYMGPGHLKENDHPVFCYQHKGSHREHRTSEEVYGVPLLSNKLLKIRRAWSVYDVWSGEFEPDETSQDIPTEDMHKNFYTEIYSYMKEIENFENGLYMTLDRLLYQYDININQQHVTYRRACCFCLREPNVIYDIPCRGTLVCYECQDRRSVLLRTQHLIKVLPPVLDKDDCVICMDEPQIIMLEPCHHQRFCEKCAEEIYNRFKRCPLCRRDITQLITPK